MTTSIEDLDQQMVEFLVESYGSELLGNPFAKEDLGWKKLGEDDLGGEVLSRDVLVAQARRARIMSVADPLITRAVSLRTAYIFGQGVSINAQQEGDSEQDVDAVVQAFMDDPENYSTFGSGQAREEMERILETDGQHFIALPTDRGTGRVRVRRIPFRQIKDILTDPEDAESPWLYKREWQVIVVESGYGGVTTRTRKETRRALYPDVDFRPSVRPKTIDGIPVMWDTPIVHTRVNRVDGSRWGTPDLLAALPWAEGYKGFLEDWARLMKSLSKIAWRATGRGSRAAQTRSRLEAADPNMVGGAVTLGEGQRFEAVSKSGATLDSESGRPLAAMVAAAVDVPVTMLLGDPGVTGARATAETLDQPMQLSIKARQEVHAAFYVRVLTYVIDQSIKAPQGILKGGVRIDPITKREIVFLAADQPKGIQIDWPSLDKTPMKTLLDAVAVAEGLNLVPDEILAKAALMALDVDNPEEIVKQMIDDQTGEFTRPRPAPDVTPTDVAAQAATEAYRRGEDAAEYV